MEPSLARDLLKQSKANASSALAAVRNRPGASVLRNRLESVRADIDRELKRFDRSDPDERTIPLPCERNQDVDLPRAPTNGTVGR